MFGVNTDSLIRKGLCTVFVSNLRAKPALRYWFPCGAGAPLRNPLITAEGILL